MELDDGQQISVSWRVDRYCFPVTIKRIGQRLWFSYAFNKKITEVIKIELSGKWHGFEDPPVKFWSAAYNHHNRFRIDFHTSKNPYSIYDNPPNIDFNDTRPLKPHQINMTLHASAVKRTVIAGEMGVGKTLSMISLIDSSGIGDWLWVGPKSGIYSVKLEFKKWNAKIIPRFMTYNELVSLVEQWTHEDFYRGIIFDESHCIKTPNSQRTKAAMHFSHKTLERYGNDSYVILMTGTPAPKSPMDWYSQCEIARPGFLKEGDHYKFKERLAIVSEQSAATGGSFNSIISWRDSTEKCSECGLPENDSIHQYHPFNPCVNEVEVLHKRMKGLVFTLFKKDCTGLPDKIFKTIRCNIPDDVKRAAKMIINTSVSTIKALTSLRELSDGFLYTESVVGQETCKICNGKGEELINMYNGDLLSDEELIDLCTTKGIMLSDRVYNDLFPFTEFPEKYEKRLEPCSACYGTGSKDMLSRTVTNVGSPKDQVVKDLLLEYSDSRRVVIFAGFTASLDRLTEIVSSQGWEYIRVDGRGWTSNFGMSSAEDLLQTFQNKKDNDRKIVFIGHPGSAGVGITLTASPVAIFYSNDFNATNRIQAMDRIHRLGMDEQVGATIIDIVNLPSDVYVIKNLNQKVKLQDISLGRLRSEIQEIEGEDHDVYE